MENKGSLVPAAGGRKLNLRHQRLKLSRPTQLKSFSEIPTQIHLSLTQLKFNSSPIPQTQNLTQLKFNSSPIPQTQFSFVSGGAGRAEGAAAPLAPLKFDSTQVQFSNLPLTQVDLTQLKLNSSPISGGAELVSLNFLIAPP